ncbi:hypothetical protein CMV_017495 [Castanea mollissima]|uniref:Uncharacterized protein n=1 Tax=Castanea mollissima TaxID=60419 RepID=A0A8J4VIK1_9ROSI|nr:hypothetical protein CMV_017495 [Castanea mollissima]
MFCLICLDLLVHHWVGFFHHGFKNLLCLFLFSPDLLHNWFLLLLLKLPLSLLASLNTKALLLLRVFLYLDAVLMI